METINKKSPTLFLEGVLAEAKNMKRKEEIYESIMDYEKELKLMKEHGFVGTFGFKQPNDISSKNTTGFEATPDISMVNQLAKEMSPNDSVKDSENEKLRNEIKELKDQLAEAIKQK